MAISSLNSAITSDLISKIAKAGSTSKSTNPTAKTPQEPLSVTLQRGAQGAAAAIQSLNTGINFINVAKEYTQNMLQVVNALDDLVKRAGRGDITPSKAKEYKNEFDQISKSYDTLLAGSVVRGRDLLGTEDISQILKQGGLDPQQVSELESAFSKISSFAGVDVSAAGKTSVKGSLFPAQDFYRAVRQAVRDPEDPPQNDDGSAGFSKIRLAVKALHDKVSRNVEALSSAEELVQRNVELVRATGFAFLDASEKVTGAKDADSLAIEIRGAIRSKASGSLGEAHNLNAILAAGLLSVSKSDK